ncbi:pupal cuticle protein Edg-78E-like [Musca vetustissima]|uniref:pupal cuticle protein Edg-78E-like n=1 Tax=Musca vetustissima TaxID=27455 RepID=UPI002AB63B4F|nr:pupal cuticle protein Edg-78E-like [Musca vetustissima]
MKSLICLLIIVCSVCSIIAVSEDGDAHTEIIRFVNELNHGGTYKYHYETSNGITAEEEGEGGHYAKGGFAYYSDNEELYQLSYKADELGFHPSAEHLPKPHPIPEAILKSIEYIRTHPQQEGRTGGGGY